MPKSRQSHLSLDDRIQIRRLLSQNQSFREIARTLGVCASTISREVKLRRITKNGSIFNNQNSKDTCSNSRIFNSPWICQGCDSYSQCRKMKVVYYADVAHKSYLNTLIDKRIKFQRSSEAFDFLNRLLDPLIKDNSQSIDYIYATHHESIGISKSTLYRYIDKGYLVM